MSFLKVTKLVGSRVDYISELQIPHSPLSPLGHAASLAELRMD